MQSPVGACGKSSHEINNQIKELIQLGETRIQILETQAQHNLAVGILASVSISFKGSVGYYCGGLMDGPNLEILGNVHGNLNRNEQ